MIEKTKFKGTVQVKHWDSEGNLLRDSIHENLVVTTGLQWIAGRLNDPAPAVMNYIAVGTSNTAPALNQTALFAEVARVVVTVPGGSTSGQTIVYSATYNPGVGTGALQEAGIFQSLVGSTMLSRVTYPVINKGPSDTISIIWTIAAQ
jgi:hypothetical protein